MARKSATVTRQSNGMGTIRLRKDGRWEARFTAGYDMGTKKQIQRSIYGKTKTEVVKQLREALHAMDKQEYIAPSTITVKEWFEKWIKDYCVIPKASSKAVYERNIKNYIVPKLGAVKLQKLTTDNIQTALNELSETLSPHMIKDIRAVIHAALERAVDNELIYRNPCRKVEIRKVDLPDITILSSADRPAFLAACDKNSQGDFIKLLLYTGCRISELMGLPWRNVDFENGKITIDQQLENGTYKITKPKTKAGKRTFGLEPQALEILENIRILQSAQKALLGDQWGNDLDLVFTNELGEPYRHNTVRKNFHRVSESIGINNMRVHDLRHTRTVDLIRAGVDLTTIAYMLGHEDINTTLGIYARCTDEMKQAATEKMTAYYAQDKPVRVK